MVFARHVVGVMFLACRMWRVGFVFLACRMRRVVLTWRVFRNVISFDSLEVDFEYLWVFGF